MPTPTAVLVVVGSEVLSAKVVDENGPWAARRLHELGVRLLAIQTVPDRIDDVVGRGGSRPAPGRLGLHLGRRRADPRRRHGRGGGARARPARRALRAARRGDPEPFTGNTTRGAEPPEAVLRMADVPEGTRLLGDAGYPTLVAANVVMLPGVPSFFRFQFDRIVHLLEAPPFRLACVFLSVGEGEIAPALDRVASEHPLVEIGSYPRFDEADHRVKVTLEAKDAARVAAALAALLAELPPGAVVRTEGP